MVNDFYESHCERVRRIMAGDFFTMHNGQPQKLEGEAFASFREFRDRVLQGIRHGARVVSFWDIQSKRGWLFL